MNNIILKISNLKVKFNENLILDNINIEIEEGKYISIVGPNGSGKSTLLKTIMGLNHQYTGTIEIFGQQVNSTNSKQIAYVPQVKTLDRNFPALAIELVISGFKNKWSLHTTKAEEELALSYLSKVNAENLSNHKLSQLSGGELQRVYLARSLVKKPKLLLLDEPATGIDMVCEHSINNILTEYNQKYNTTIIMVTHDWSSAYHHTNQVLMLNKHQVYFGDSKLGFSEKNIQHTFSHPDSKHGITFGLKDLN